ncbi:4'-phosphopantetheinyl transferase family protein [Inhella gelatinilytica]|uniref:4'-phosphopantetheinyl transferase N-terminal domain-containing protein n=1 Tax=Inhella gelatinilytica TaxID=2795030 RepID=A0A931IVV0_9BURK|nr:hypothetical protein [Inhella gelatinilytica]MBH9551593.1 hypothetical protein [Inhella gelatinilytica]
MAWARLERVSAVLASMPDPQAWCEAAEVARSQAFSRPERQQRFWAGRWLLRELLQQARGGVNPLTVDAQGCACDPQGWHLSLSHSGDWMAAAVCAMQPIGVDVEVPKPRRDWQALALHCDFEPCQTAEDFYRQWTLVEAWFKVQPPPQEAYGWKRWRWLAHAQGPAACWAGEGLNLALYGWPDEGRLQAAVTLRPLGRWAAQLK